MTGLPHFIKSIMNCARDAKSETLFHLGELEFSLWPGEKGHVQWLKSYLQPAVVERPVKYASQRAWKVGSYFDMEIIKDISVFKRAGYTDWVDVWTGRKIVHRMFFGQNCILDFDPEEGFACCYDLAQKQVIQVTSAHTTSSVHELGRLLRDIYTAHMRFEGWELFHAGAFRANDTIYMVPGASGAGKTSLIVAMVKSGAEFVSNDRVFLKCNKEGVSLRPYPMAAAIGLGTVQQYSTLRGLVLEPWELQYPRRRYHYQKVQATPEFQWPQLEEKLQFFPNELMANLEGGGSGIHGGGQIGAIISPQLNDIQRSEFKRMSRSSAQEILKKSYIDGNTDITSPWRPLPWQAHPVENHHLIINRLLEFPLVNFTFYASRSRMNEVSSYSSYLREAMDSLFPLMSGDNSSD